MKIPQGLIITDHLFFQTISCPLKLPFTLCDNKSGFGKTTLRQRNKLVLRNAIALDFPNTKFTEDHTETALKQTREWLTEHTEVTICGAVLKSGNFLTRIPILHKKGNKLQIVQVHGKLVKSQHAGIFDEDRMGRTAAGYLLKAAYRTEITGRVFPDTDISAKFIFPVKKFRSQHANLFRAALGKKSLPDEVSDELNRLFTRIEATNATLKIAGSLPESHAYKTFAGKPISRVMEMIENREFEKPKEIHETCKYCDFRKSNGGENSGCWSKHFVTETILNPELHLFEAVGPAEAGEAINQIYFRENGTQPPGFETAEKITGASHPVISIQQRRALQLLAAKGEPVPLVWAKSFLGKLINASYPLHFLDFEAATHPVPMEMNSAPYDPVLFQFSCHTLYEDGKLLHTGWLDTDPDTHPHNRLVDALLGIPDFDKGTILQYSPFERQSLFRLMHELAEADQPDNGKQIQLKQILRYGTSEEKNRFIDLNKAIHDGYYNRFMTDGLSLKQVLNSIVSVEKYTDFESFGAETEEENGLKIHENRTDNPYVNYTESELSIYNGESAMNGYLAIKSGAVSSQERQYLTGMLKQYCTLDSYALLVIFRHLSALFSEEKVGHDILILNDNLSENKTSVL